MASTPTLKHFVNLWTLSSYPPGGEEWSFRQKLTAIKAAGFDGYQGWAKPEGAEIGAECGLEFLGAFDAGAETYAARLEAFVPIKPVRINVQLCDHFTPPQEAARVWLELDARARDLGLLVDLEVHRDTCTETPEKTWRIADIVSQQTGRPIRMNFDFSHFAVVKHLHPPFAERLLDHPELLQASRQIHLRPFNGHHAQIPATDGHGNQTEEIKQWFDFVGAAFACWLGAESNAGETLWACPEFSSMHPGYWLPGFPDTWQDTILVRKEIERLWKASLKR